MQQKFFIKPFAVDGDRDDVPDDTQVSGDVSYEQGYGYDYQRDQSNDPLAKPMPRGSHNAILHDITDALQQYQAFGTPEWITAEDNGGTAYPYAHRTRVRYRASSSDPWNVYESLADNNTAPPSDTDKWATIASVIATQDQAVAGEDNATVMTPLRVAQATANKQPSLGYKPVQQGTGVGQNENTVKIGWSSADKRLKATVDSTNLGNVVFDAQLADYPSQQWVANNYASLGNLEYQIGTRVPIRAGNSGYGYALCNGTSTVTLQWNANNDSRIYAYIDDSKHGSLALMSDVRSIGDAVSQRFYSPEGRIKPEWRVGEGNLTVTVDGSQWGISIFASDERVKENIEPSKIKALDIINQINLISFNYKPGLIFDSQSRQKIGFSAQQLHSIDPNMVIGGSEGEMVMAPDLMIVAAYLTKAVQELSTEVAQLRAAMAKK